MVNWRIIMVNVLCFLLSVHHVTGWSFSINERAKDLDVQNLPSVDNGGVKRKHTSFYLKSGRVVQKSSL